MGLKDKLIDKGFAAFDKTSDKLDEREFTDEEKSKANFKVAQAMTDFATKIAESTTPKSRARRLAAYFVIGLHSMTFIQGLYYINTERYEQLKVLIDYCDSMKITVAFITVIGFFFSSYLIMQGIDKLKK